MPVMECTSGGKSGFKWGNSGKCFTGKGARNRALKQGLAISFSQKRKGKKPDIPI